MKLIDLYNKKDFVFSIEIFPPKTDKGVEKLKSTLKGFRQFAPDYMSVTYGAGGTSRKNTHEMAVHINHELGIPAMAHLTCVSHTADEIDKVLTSLKNRNIENVMALRGDPPVGTDRFVRPEGGYQYASELISAIRKHSSFAIGAAGYPEGHVENPDKEEDRIHLHEKIACGAQFIISQFFLDNIHFLRWRDLLRHEGVALPLIAGILPPTNWHSLQSMSAMCGVSIPKQLAQDLIKQEDDPEVCREIGFDHVERQLEELLSEGVEGVHLYALNRLETVERLGPQLQKASGESLNAVTV